MLDWLQKVPWLMEYAWLYRVVYSLGVVAFATLSSLIIKTLLSRIIRKRSGKNRRADTLTKLIGSAIRYLIQFIALIQVLKVGLEIDITAILGAAGVMGLAVGFGAQSLVKDVITGFFILLEGQYAVGEHIKIDDFEGRVEELGLRTTKIRAEDDGRVLFIPNGSIVKVINFSRYEPWRKNTDAVIESEVGDLNGEN